MWVTGARFVWVCLTLGACTQATEQAARSQPDPVTQWTEIADFYGDGQANIRTLPIMHMAMHDALIAVQPTYARWAPATADEPPAAGADAELAMDAAAHEVLLLLHPARGRNTDRIFARILTRWPDGPTKDASIRLGTVIGAAAVHRRDGDGYTHVRYFIGSAFPGKWRPTPQDFATSPTNNMRPFLFATVNDIPFNPPPALDSEQYRQELAETRRIGAGFHADRTIAATSSGLFWAGQSSQRGFVHLAVLMLAANPRPGGMFEEARIMSQLTNAMADSAIFIWTEKEKYYFWRPIDAIRTAGKAAGVDQDWVPLLETPPFPEYPSGHAGDCFIGAGVLEAVFPDVHTPITYFALDTAGTPENNPFGMGQHAQHGGLGGQLTFPSLAAAAEDCSNSRVWAGAHFRAADEEARRLSVIIVARAIATVPKLK
jgi:hypothetical protein